MSPSERRVLPTVVPSHHYRTGTRGLAELRRTALDLMATVDPPLSPWEVKACRDVVQRMRDREYPTGQPIEDLGVSWRRDVQLSSIAIAMAYDEGVEIVDGRTDNRRGGYSRYQEGVA